MKIRFRLRQHTSDWQPIYMQVFLISLVTSLIYAMVAIGDNIRRSNLDTERNISELEYIVNILAPVVEGFDLTTVDAIGAELEGRAYIQKVRIIGPLDYEMYHSSKEAPKTSLRVIDLALPIEPIGAEVSNVVGELQVALLAPTIGSLLAMAVKRSIFVFLVAFAVGAITTYIYANRFITDPLKRLQDAIELTLTSGQPVEARETGQGFIGKFQAQFNRMQGQLLQSQNESTQKSSELEITTQLIRNLLENVNTKVRLFKAHSYEDLGIKLETVPLPNHPMFTSQEFIAFLERYSEMVDLKLARVNNNESEDETVLFDVDLVCDISKWFNVKSVRLPNHHHAFVVADVTQAKEVEMSLQHAEKMEVVGTLTSGIAHDFNNILAIISGNLELISNSSKDPIKVEHYSSSALNAAQRAASVLTSLLAFSKRKPDKHILVPVDQVLEEVAVIAQTALSTQIVLKSECNINANLNIDLANLQSALINLIVNARDAMPNGGNIQLSAQLTNTEEALANGLSLDRPYITISVQDDGNGIPPHLLEKVKSSFFTTKQNGTGLGLAMVKNFSHGAGGALSVKNNPSKGVTSSIILPVQIEAQNILRTVPSDQEADQQVAKGSSILIIDDEDGLREITCKIIETFGHHAIPCSGIIELREILKTSTELPDLIITDLNLTDGTGLDLLNEEFEELKDIPKVLLSGNMEVNGKEIIQSGFAELQLKPMTLSEMREMLNRLLKKIKISTRKIM